MTAAVALVLALGLPPHGMAVAQDGSVLRESVSLGSASLESMPLGSALPELEPIGTRRVVAGQRWQLYMRGRDPDGELPSLVARDLPPGAMLVPAPLGGDWYVLDWTPPADLVGPVDLTIEAIDARVPTWRTERVVRLEVVADPSLPRIAPVPGQIVSAGVPVRFGVKASLGDGRVPLVRIAPMPPGATLDRHTDGTYVFQWLTDASDRGEYRLNVTAMDPDRDTRRSSVDTLLIVSNPSQESLASDGAGAEPVGVESLDYDSDTYEDPAEYVVEYDTGLDPNGGTGEEPIAEEYVAEEYIAEGYIAEEYVAEEYVAEDYVAEQPLPAQAPTGEYLVNDVVEYVEDGSGVVYDANGYPVDADGKPIDPNSLL